MQKNKSISQRRKISKLKDVVRSRTFCHRRSKLLTLTIGHLQKIRHERHLRMYFLASGKNSEREVGCFPTQKEFYKKVRRRKETNFLLVFGYLIVFFISFAHFLAIEVGCGRI